MIWYFLITILSLIAYFKFFRTKKENYEILAKYYGDKSWCVGKESVDTTIYPFKISISERDLEDLRQRLELTRFPTPALKDSKFHYGVNEKFMRDLLDYWKNSYSWRRQEREMNKFTQFKTKIEGLDIHFVHIKPKATSIDNKPRPLLICNGWPSTFYEYFKIIPMLTDPTSHGGNETDLFEVIVPSIPGYGFSEAPEVMGFNSLHCARIFHKLMLRLGHKTYYLQGGDWGSLICTHMAMMYSSAVRGIHTNMGNSKLGTLENLRLLGGCVSPKLFFKKQDAEKWFPLKKTLKLFLAETGYMHIQATKPDTIGFALSDSPAGLAAYILEKFSSWTDMDGRDKEDGDMWKYWTKDELLNTVMIYWWSRNITSSMRLYKEALRDSGLTQTIKVHVPAGYAWFPNELVGVFRETVARKCPNLISFTYMKKGGHFPAMQVPDLLVEDFREFVRKIEIKKQKDLKDEEEFSDYRQTHLDRFERS